MNNKCLICFSDSLQEDFCNECSSKYLKQLESRLEATEAGLQALSDIIRDDAVTTRQRILYLEEQLRKHIYGGEKDGN